MSYYRLYYDKDENSQVIPKVSNSNRTVSLPSSPSEKLNLTVIEKVRSFENLISASESLEGFKFKMSGAKLEYNPLKGTRTSLKG